MSNRDTIHVLDETITPGRVALCGYKWNILHFPVHYESINYIENIDLTSEHICPQCTETTEFGRLLLTVYDNEG